MPIDSKFLRGFYEYRPSAVALVLANLIPLFGVLFLGWDAFAIVVLYWVENLIIGAINVLKMLTCSPDEREIDWSKFGKSSEIDKLKQSFGVNAETVDNAKLVHHGSKLFFIPFFIFHYGMFCLVHGVFVFSIFGHDEFGPNFGPFGPLGNLFGVFSEQHLWWGVIALAASHVYSFFVNYLWGGEYKRTFIMLLMVQPYARVVVLHVAILLGGFVAMALGSSVAVLAILVIGKTLLDLHFHLLERVRDAGLSGQKAKSGSVLDEAPA